MSIELEERLSMAAHETKLKYVNVLLLMSAACIGFSVTQSNAAVLTYWTILWCLPVLCWAFSFYCGCNYLFTKSIAFNIQVMQVQVAYKRHPLTGENEQNIQAALDSLMNGKLGYTAVDRKNARNIRMQLWAFITGAGLFLVWHLAEMWRRIPENMCLWV